MELNGLLEYSFGMVIKSAQALGETGRTEELACGIWSARDVIGHLYGFKRLTEDVVSTFLGNTATPYLDLWLKVGPDNFGEEQVTARQGFSFEANLAAYKESHQRLLKLVAQLPEEQIRQAGTLPWYGTPYALDDFILYTDFGHQIEHGSQLALLRDTPVSLIVA